MFIFYDLETSGLSPAWNVPLQAAFVRTGDDLVVQDELVMRCRLPQHVVPSPDALLVTGVMPGQLEQAPLSHREMMAQIARVLAAWAPATIVGYNSFVFDEEVLRHSFFQSLLPAYATSAVGFRRADVLVMLRAVRMLEPSALTLPTAADGKVSMKLGDICRANGIGLDERDAHDALNDVNATIKLFRLLRERAPATIAATMANAHKSGPAVMLYGGELLGLGGFTSMTPVAGVMASPTNGASWAAADLSIDPSTYLDASSEELAALLRARGPRPIRMIKTNAQPILVPWEQAGPALPTERLSDAVFRERAARVRGHAGFRRNLAVALAGRYADRTPSAWPELRLYDGFVSREDAVICRRWHEIGWDQRHRLSEACLKDERLRRFAQRLAFLEAPETLSPEVWQRGRQWLHERLLTKEEVPWLTLPAALQRCDALRSHVAGGAGLDQLTAIERWLRRRHDEMARSTR